MKKSMKTNDSYWQKCGSALLRYRHTAWRFFAKHILRRPVDDEVIPGDLPDDQPDPDMNPLDQIKGFLLDHGLSRKVHVRFDNGTDYFVLEDEDGVVHAKDYDKAVAVINRTWL